MRVLFLALPIVAFYFLACEKDEKIPGCYDPTLVHNHACPQNCPGVKGCDGKTYCNECEAARKGIRIAK